MDKHLSASSLSRNPYHSALLNVLHYGTRQTDQCLQLTKAEEETSCSFTNKVELYFDVICRVVENSLSDINEVCCSIELRGFSEKDLQEYVIALKLLFRGLDILQGEDYCNYSTLFPTLETICNKTKASIPKLSTMTTGLAYAIDIARSDLQTSSIPKMPSLPQ